VISALKKIKIGFCDEELWEGVVLGCSEENSKEMIFERMNGKKEGTMQRSEGRTF